MPVNVRRLLPAGPYPLGAHWDGRGTHFAVFSEHAERVDLCLFDTAGRHEQRCAMPECTDGVWHGYMPDARPGQLYGYRAYGPYEPKKGHRFNGNKLLLDPYARQLAGELRWHDALYGYRVGSPRADLSFDRRDSAPFMPKGVVVEDHFDWGNDHPPAVPWSETVIYEMHVKGFTHRRENIPEWERGTFGALGHSSVIKYLKDLGVTAVELLPVHLFVRDRILVDQGLTNYWGYNTLGFFAPDPGYTSDGTLSQVKWAIKRLHAAGIEVILDVVYNHTCEGNELGATLCLRGFGNASYYRLSPDDGRHYINDTGTGNSVNTAHPRVIQMVMDSLRYWVSEFHIDGFRFDLGVSLGRESHGFDPWAGFFDALMQDPLLARVKLISEPWDIGPGGYQVGNHPAGMAEWNGRYRDDVRRYWKGDAGLRGALAARLLGSADLFDHHRRRPWASVNFVTAHDGFTLTDLVSYNSKHNEHNGENNQDGTNENDSSNWGVEGPTEDEGIQHQREKVKRNLLATLLLSQGTPMLLAGDEFGHTQQGNNNAYCQDNDISWLDWSLQAAGPGQKMLAFTQRLLALRKASVLLRGDAFQHATEEILPGVRDVFWFDERGNELSQADWENANARLLGHRRAGLRDDGTVDLLIVLHNSDGAEHRFVLPAPHFDFRLCIDTQIPEKPESILAEEHYDVSGHSVVLLAAAVHPVAEPAISGKLERRTARAGEAKSLIAADQEADDPSDLDGLDGAAGVPA